MRRAADVLRELPRHPRLLPALWAVLLLACLSRMLSHSIAASDKRDLRVLGGWDENHYYAWARSAVVDGDARFRNDFEFLASLRGVPLLSDTFRRALDTVPDTPTGHFPNKYGVGNALLGAPGLLVARAAVLAYGEDRVHPFATIYLVGYRASLIVVAFLGLAAAVRLLGELGHSRGVGAASVALVFLGTPLGYYIWYNHDMAHAGGFTLLTLLLLASVRWRGALRADGRSWMALAAAMGVLLALAAMARFPNAIAAVFPFALAVGEWLGAPMEFRRRILVRSVVSCLAAAGCAVAAAVPQLLAWKVVYGEYLLYSYTGERFRAWPSNAPLVLAGARNSLFLWSPLWLLALGALAQPVRRDAGVLAGLAALFAGFLWLYGSWEFYWLGTSFGMRGFVDISAVAMVGAASLVERTRGPLPGRRLLAAAVALSILWSLWMVGAYRAEVQRGGEPFAGRALVTEAADIADQWWKDVRGIPPFHARRYPLFTPRSLGEDSRGPD
ncbi:MAG: hypothetical protein SF028_14670 [Candidatus Sumerlaeia bacterium]|nr:hypothetical protein [Candidatus Sumerlaeia bacterium]